LAADIGQISRLLVGLIVTSNVRATRDILWGNKADARVAPRRVSHVQGRQQPGLVFRLLANRRRRIVQGILLEPDGGRDLLLAAPVRLSPFRPRTGRFGQAAMPGQLCIPGPIFYQPLDQAAVSDHAVYRNSY
jgi:hypothetical protein